MPENDSLAGGDEDGEEGEEDDDDDEAAKEDSESGSGDWLCSCLCAFGWSEEEECRDLQE